MMKQRDLSIDYLRFIGISMIILAHVAAPFGLTQFRCFDVPLMIFVSGLTASGKTVPDYFGYIWARSKRLLVPVYVFLTGLFLILYLLQFMDVFTGYLSMKKVVHTYLLLEGIGYVWIIRVFLLIMLLTPFLIRFEMACKNNVVYGSICLGLLFVNDLMLLMEYPLPGGKIVNIFVTEFLMYLIGYVPLFLLGLRLRYSGDKVKLTYMCCSIACCILGFAVHGFSYDLSAYKYPPQFYFLIYGVMASVCLWVFKDVICKLVDFVKIKPFALFVGQNTIWIYLWHIPFVLLFNGVIGNWFIRYVVIYACAVMMMKIQVSIVKKVENAWVSKYFMG